LKKYNTIFLDRDGTINPDPGYISSLDQFEFYDFTFSSLKRLSRDGYRFCIITNQSGVSRGLIKQKDLDNIHEYIKNQFMKNSIPLLGIYIAIDHPSSATIRRKPGVGMFLEASKDHHINLKDSLIIGDSINDIQAGKDLEMDTILVRTGRGNQTILDYPDLRPDAIVSNIEEAADWILK
jgi:D,D-heptose 1,7-bisphosphate phosphatase